ncbi:CRTAC1 family protein [Rhodocaloribacter litoris]|uniref:CRTAC1 family protein n=1 Tax=Rhodocaloribacter litoris TaxID=2558931 RepID=UPI0014220E48|nr:CRTAC1 family protein [Rhodocaloribacter litoris]QXD13758.1 CRTAC1 family protein [Rhodocaloribacter litoris]
MPKRTIRAGVVLFFLALLAFPLADRYLRSRTSTGAAGLRPEEALSRYGFYFEEVSAAAGIRFRHEAPVLDPKLDHIMPQVASMGAAVSVVDFDRDGWADLYVTSSRTGAENALYRNRGDGTFENVAPQVGLADVNREGTGVSMGAVWGDYDNDGYEDLFLYKWGRSELFHNDAGRAFTRVTDGSGLPAWANVNAAIWLDYDRDGHLDLFFGGYYPEDVNLWRLEHTRIMPESFEYANNGGRKYLLRGRGDGTFEDVTAAMGLLETRRWMMAVAAADLRGTGYPDLFIANDYGTDELYLNQEGKGFVAAGEATRVGFTPKSGMNVAFGDIVNNGTLSVYVTNITEPGILVQGNNLWVPEPSGKDLRYRNMAGAFNVEMGGWSYGAQFGDFNNDGWLDLFVTNGYVSADRERSYWYDFSKVAGGNRAIISDAKNWPAMEGRSLSGYQHKKLWLNTGQWWFQQVAQAVGVRETFDGRAVALADLWNRGVLDVVVAHQRGPLLVYRNTVDAGRDWVAFDLTGTASNRSAIGAAVELYWDGRRQRQEVSGGSGFCAQNQRRLHFGLGRGARIEKAVIRWPSGRVQTLTGLETGRIHRVVEPS